MALSSDIAARAAAGKTPIPPKKMRGPYAAFNIAALGIVVVAGAYIGSEHMPSIPDINKYWSRLRKGGGGEGGGPA
ncbi:hypothetical protein CC85DRAFT_285043 [Cutaneotrichosporon oleaginosum]|uniref:Uncharacterized protein n=1 Tax=Cutaneotrichosporon oleaginosum TaxID=879819 RepID=A0A0J1B5E2_9TREE|nr:uncharacterized protein CC85DRAFT_285043 [Cutaneotrichosporon oleaginosum]KLT42894.1 hypothetical protein CC85DRAFT_285043 [Cutaneotrichosporon oleaginosum]TXT12598.1 hypothetical protein COLE_03008 [Cutaneotrichosporon oleaginosum]